MIIIKQIIEENDTKPGLIFDLSMQLLIVVSLVTFSIETLPDLQLPIKTSLHYIEIFTVGVFTIEYLGRIFVADRKIAFVFSFYGLIDLFAILPFYLSTGVDLRSIRTLRLLKLFRAFKLFRYSRAIQRFHKAFILAREELILFFCVTLILLYLSSVGIYYFENQAQPENFKSVFHSMWWAVATLTTVGYGDVYPVTLGGRVFTFFILMIGLGVVAVPTGLLATALSEARNFEETEKDGQR